MKKKFPVKSKKKDVQNENLKETILNFWFWVIVAIISYFIFASIPITWNESGFGWDTFEGTNFIKTLFAYITQIAWIIAVSLLIVSGIKYIQKTKINDYWKISLTILGVILIIAFVIYFISDLGIFDKFSYKYDERIGDLDNKDIIKIHINLLEKDGYEVLYFGYLMENTTIETAYLEMKSFGNRKEQVLRGVGSLSMIYPNTPEYTIIIFEPTKECSYEIQGRIYRGALGKEEVILNGEIVDGLKLYQLLEYQINNKGICS